MGENSPQPAVDAATACLVLGLDNAPHGNPRGFLLQLDPSKPATYSSAEYHSLLLAVMLDHDRMAERPSRR